MAGVYESLTNQQKLRLTLQRDVQAICKEACQIVDLDVQDDAVELVTELAWNSLQVYGSDLEQFAKHAKRTTINTEDIKLLVRRNAGLKSYIMSYAETISTSGSKEKKKKGPTANVGNSKSKLAEEMTKTTDKPSTSNKEKTDEPTIDLT